MIPVSNPSVVSSSVLDGYLLKKNPDIRIIINNKLTETSNTLMSETSVKFQTFILIISNHEH